MTSNGNSTPGKGKRLKNKHWKWLRTTFRELNLAKAILPGGELHGPVSEDEDSIPFTLSEKTALSYSSRTPTSSARRKRSRRDHNSSHKKLNKAAVPLPDVSPPARHSSSGDCNIQKTSDPPGSASLSPNSYGDNHDSFTSVASSASENTKSVLHSSLEDARQLLQAQEHRKRRLVFLQQTAIEEEFVCKTLGMDRAYGRCIRHSNQPITNNPVSLLLGTDFCTVNICRICQSEIRVGPEALQPSLPFMGNVIEQVQKLQSNTKEWDRRTKILGAGILDLNEASSHHSGGGSSNQPPMSIATETIVEDTDVEEFGGDDSLSLKDLDGSITSHSKNVRNGRSQRSSSSTLQYTEEEWAKQLSRRISQVRTWEDRFAIKNHPTFCQYFKMLRIGVPIKAVQYTAEMDGYHPSILGLDPNKSLKMQQHVLSQDAQENLRVTGALSEETDFEQELSIPQTVQKVLTAFRQRRMNQVFATMALFSEMKVKKHLQQQRYESVLEEHSESYRSIQSMPNPLTEELAENLSVTAGLSASHAQVLEMDDDISQSARLSVRKSRINHDFRVAISEGLNIREKNTHQVPSSPVRTENKRFQPSNATTLKTNTGTSLKQASLSPESRSTRNATIRSPRIRHTHAEKNPSTPAEHSTTRSSDASSRRSQSEHPTVASPSRSNGFRTLTGSTIEDHFDHYQNSLLLELANVLEADDGVDKQPDKYTESKTDSLNTELINDMKNEGDSISTSPILVNKSDGVESPKKSFTPPKGSNSQRRSRKIPKSPPVKELVLTDSGNVDFVDHEQIQDELESLIRRESHCESSKRNTFGDKMDDDYDDPVTRKIPANDPKLDEEKKSESVWMGHGRQEHETEGVDAAKDDKYRALLESDESASIPRMHISENESSHEVFVPMSEYVKVNAELDLAMMTIEFKDEEIRNCVKIEAYKNLLSQLVDAEAAMLAKDKVINDSIRRDDYDKISGELESARAAIVIKDIALEETVSKQKFEELTAELVSSKASLALWEKAMDQSVRLEDYQNLSKELDGRDETILDLKQQFENLKKELESCRSMLAEKDVTVQELGEELGKKDATIERLRKRLYHMEKRPNAQVLENSTMQAKIEDAKSRQTALRQKLRTPHRSKQAGDAPPRDRDFDALALSPASKSGRSVDERHNSRPHRSKPTGDAPPRDRDFEALALSPASKSERSVDKKHNSRPHRSEQTGDAPPRDRDFDALALSPASKSGSGRSVDKRHSRPHRSKQTGDAPPRNRDSDALALSPASKSGSGRSVDKRHSRPKGRSRGSHSTLSTASASPTAQAKRQASPSLSPSETLPQHSIPATAKKPMSVPALQLPPTSPMAADNAMTKDVILNLFDSWSSQQFAS